MTTLTDADIERTKRARYRQAVREMDQPQMKHIGRWLVARGTTVKEFRQAMRSIRHA